MELKEIIGTGAQATVYASEEYAIKLFQKNYNKVAIFYEALINSMIEKTGLPIAKTYEVLNINNQLAIKMDYIKGSSLIDCILQDKNNVTVYVENMVKLHLKIHDKRIFLPLSLKDKLRNKIQETQYLDIYQKENLLTLLKNLPDGNQLCHGDFYGYNILLYEDEFYIIDWVDSTYGCVDGDVCRTYMLYSLYHSELAELYLSLYCEISGKEKNQILIWLPVIAAARLSENINNEKEKLISWINDTSLLTNL